MDPSGSHFGPPGTPESFPRELQRPSDRRPGQGTWRILEIIENLTKNHTSELRSDGPTREVPILGLGGNRGNWGPLIDTPPPFPSWGTQRRLKRPLQTLFWACRSLKRELREPQPRKGASKHSKSMISLRKNLIFDRMGDPPINTIGPPDQYYWTTIPNLGTARE